MFVNSKRMAPYVGQELREKLQNPLIFQAPSAGGISPPPSVKALRTHPGQVLGIARISRTKEEYEGHINQLFGDQPDLFHQQQR